MNYLVEFYGKKVKSFKTKHEALDYIRRVFWNDSEEESIVRPECSLNCEVVRFRDREGSICCVLWREF